MPEPLPSKPFACVKFSLLTPSEIKSLGEEAVEKIKAQNMEYLDHRDKVINANRSNKRWLEKMLSYFKFKQNSERVNSINNRLKLYQGVC